MNEWFKKTLETVRGAWGKWTALQRALVIGIAVVVIAAIILTITLSSRPSTVRLFNGPVNDETERERILSRLDEDNVRAYVSTDNYISVDDEATARKYRSLLITEGLTPSRIDAYSLFDVTRWSRNDFDDNVNWKRAMETRVKQLLEVLDGIDRAEVVLTLPEDSLFAENQAPTSASVVLYARGGSDILEDRSQVRGIQNLVLRAVEGLQEENIVIVDGLTNTQINDFTGMAETDRISNIERQQRLIQTLQAQIASRTLNALKETYGGRVRVAQVAIDMDMSERTSQSTEYTGITVRPDNPDTPYDDSEIRDSLVVSEETVSSSFTGTGYNPEGPAGVEGQNPPVYSDMSNVAGTSTEDTVRRNYALNERNVSEVSSPRIDRLTVSVNIDGVWRKNYDANGNLIVDNSGHISREYIPIEQSELDRVAALVRDAVGYSAARGDSVTVTNIPFDRTEEQEAEDRALLASRARTRVVVFVLIGVAALLLAFIVFRVLSRAVERRRKLAEEERVRRQEEERQRALMEAQEQGVEVTMSVEERAKAELQETAVAMARDHPEDVALLVRTWLSEE